MKATVRKLVIEACAMLTNPAISALILAIQMIITHCKKLKWKRKIVLVTNGMGEMSSENLDDIVSKVKEDNIELVIL